MNRATPGCVRVYRMPADRLLRDLPDGSIDVLITDPPYLTVTRRPASGYLRDWFGSGLSWPEIGRVLTLARRKLKPSGLAFVMTNSDGLASARAAMERAGFVGIRTITWDRRFPGLGGGLRHRTEFILLGRLPGSRPVAGADLISVAAVGPGTANRYPTEKPVGLGQELARMAGVGRQDLVVDPFCGSGSLLVGATRRGATVIGGDVAARAVRLARALLGAPAEGRPPSAPPASPLASVPTANRQRGTATRSASRPHPGPTAPRKKRQSTPAAGRRSRPVRRRAKGR